MAEPRTVLSDRVPERSTYVLTATVEDHAGTPLGPTSLATLTLLLFDAASGTVINSVNRVNILNAGRGTLTSGGVLTLALEPLDNQLVDASRSEEAHVALVEWTYGAKEGRHEIVFFVTNLTKVP